MVPIAAGTFMMGANDGRPDEKPAHQVQVAALAMDLTEVTLAAYKVCVRAATCTAPGTGNHCNWGRPGRENHPINCVDWKQATAYCAWAGNRLPTEEEWEYAARGAEGRTYPWGSHEPARLSCTTMRPSMTFCIAIEGRRDCPYDGRTEEGTCPVGSFPSGDSPFGLHNMAGNVGEWTASGYSDDYTKDRSHSFFVYRGGAWSDVPRATRRYGQFSAYKSSGVGFRCAR
jgi:sulfatase modifying factor 1